MSLADDIYLGQLIWADLTAAEKRNAVYDQLVEGRDLSEITDALSRIYGPIGKNHVVGVIDRHDLNDDVEVCEARRMRRADELRAIAARARKSKPELPKREILAKMPGVKIGTGRTARNITLFDLKDWHCKRPLWDRDAQGPENKFYCGAPVLEGKSYCATCNERLTERPKPVKPRKPYRERQSARFQRWK